MKRQCDTEFKIDAARSVADQGYSVPEASECSGAPPGNTVPTYRQTKA